MNSRVSVRVRELPFNNMENKIRMREIDAKSDPCQGCMNGPKPASWCTGCSNFANACKLHNIDPTTFGPVKIDVTGVTPTGIMEGKTSRYSEAQKKAVKMHLDFCAKLLIIQCIITYRLKNQKLRF